MKQIRGSTQVCFDHLRQFVAADSSIARSIRKAMEDFFSTTNDTVLSWLKGEFSPSGLNLVKLRYFLENCGYEVEELEQLDPYVRKLGKMIVYGILNFEEVAVDLNIGKRKTLFNNLHGKTVPIEEKLQRIKTLAGSFEDLLAKEEGTEPIPCIIREKEPEEPRESHERVLSRLAGFIKGAIPLAERILSNEFSEEERRTLRVMVDGDGVHILQNCMTRLTSEKSREVVPAYDKRQRA